MWSSILNEAQSYYIYPIHPTPIPTMNKPNSHINIILILLLVIQRNKPFVLILAACFALTGLLGACRLLLHLQVWVDYRAQLLLVVLLGFILLYHEAKALDHLLLFRGLLAWDYCWRHLANRYMLARFVQTHCVILLVTVPGVTPDCRYAGPSAL